MRISTRLIGAAVLGLLLSGCCGHLNPDDRALLEQALTASKGVAATAEKAEAAANRAEGAASRAEAAAQAARSAAASAEQSAARAEQSAAKAANAFEMNLRK